MNATRRLFLPALLPLLAGCFPEERVWWSPQGDRALVSLEGRLHLADADGRLGEALPGDVPMNDALVKTVSWLRDGSGFVAQRARVVTNWDELRGLIPAEEIREVEMMLPLVMPLLETAAKLGAGAKTLEDVTAGMSERQLTRFAHATRRAFEQEPERVEKLLLALPKGTDLAASFTKPGSGYEISELCVFKLADGAVVETRPLVRSLLNPAVMPHVSPGHGALAFLTLDDDGKSTALEVITLDGGARRTVARRVSAAFDWTPDGRALVFMAPLGGEGEKLQGIHRVEVITEASALTKAGALTKPGRPATLATAITLSRPVVRVLADGRVLFASQPVTLPAVGTGPELSPRLFIIAADGSAVTPVPTAPGDLPANLGFFTVSPDGKRVAVAESETDAVAVVEVDTGRTHLISPPHPRWHCRTMPAWKSATELTHAALHEGAPAWMLWQADGKTRRLSETWPASATAKWLELQREDAAKHTEISKPETRP